MRNNCIFSGEIVVTVEVCVIRCLLCSFKAKNKKCFDLKMFSFNHCLYALNALRLRVVIAYSSKIVKL